MWKPAWHFSDPDTSITHVHVAVHADDLAIVFPEDEYLWHEDGRYRIADDLGRRLSCEESDDYRPVFRAFSGHRYYLNQGTTYPAVLWYSSGLFGWVLSDNLGCSTDEAWTGSAYAGNEWYLLAGSDPVGAYVARGSLRGSVEGKYNGTPVDVAWKVGWDGWARLGSLAGVYEPEGSATGRRAVGWRLLSYGSELLFVQLGCVEGDSLADVVFISATGTYLRYDGTNWVIDGKTTGAVDAASGYYLGPAGASGLSPFLGTYEWTQTVMPDPAIEDIVLDAVSYSSKPRSIAGSKTEYFKLSEVSIWQ